MLDLLLDGVELMLAQLDLELLERLVVVLLLRNYGELSRMK